MWPFSKKKFGLIDALYLEENGIPANYQNAFNWTKKDLKSEIKRNDVNIAEKKKIVSELETKFQSNDMIRSELNAELDKLAQSDDDDKNSQLFQKLDGERKLKTSENEKITGDKLQEMILIENYSKSNAMLNSIISGLSKNPNHLTQKGIKYDGLTVKSALEGLPSEEELMGETTEEMERRRSKFNNNEE